MIKLTLEFLNTNNACKAGISFAVNNKLLGFPLDKLNDVKGDHCGFVSWLIEEIKKVKEYDLNNNLIYYKTSCGYERWNEYDTNNNLIHYKNNDGFEKWYEYDANNNLVHNLTHYKSGDSDEEWYDYDDNNNLIHYKNSSGYEEWCEIEYYDDGQLKKYKSLEIPWFEKEVM